MDKQIDKEVLRQNWKQLASGTNTKPSAGLHVQYCLMKALLANTNEKHKLAVNMIYQAFRPITNAIKLANGQLPYQAVRDAITWVSVYGNKSPLYGLLDEESEKTYLQILMHVVRATALPKLEKMVSKDSAHLYLSVRNDLSPEQITIQTSHLTYEAGFLLATMGVMMHPSFVVFGITSEEAMEARYAALPPTKILGYYREEKLAMMTGFVLKPMLASFARRKRYFVNDQLMTMVNPERTMRTILVAEEVAVIDMVETGVAETNVGVVEIERGTIRDEC